MVNPVQNSTSTTNAVKADPAPQGSSLAGGDFETFLKMLTTQIKNQDPLNPMEGSEFAVQLATFSGVEQQVQTNVLLEKLVSAGGTNSLASYSDWIGKQVRTSGEVFFGESALTMDISPEPNADQVKLIALDRYGRRAQVNDIGVASGLIDWYGRTESGYTLPSGLYRFQLESYRDGKLISSTNVPVYSTVYEVLSDESGVRFVLNGGANAQESDIDGIASPKTS